MLERGALPGGKPVITLPAVQVAHEAIFPVMGHPVSQDVVVHPAADVDRVDLDVAVVRDCLANSWRLGVKQVGAAQEPARLRPRGLARVGHGPAGRVGWDLGAGPAAGAWTAGGCSDRISAT